MTRLQSLAALIVLAIGGSVDVNPTTLPDPPDGPPISAEVFRRPTPPRVEMANGELPWHVSSEPGKVTLFADYSDVTEDGSIPVYLINATARDLELESQGWDIYLKLEVLNERGVWKRAQPHAFNWCGNAYGRWTLPAGRFLRVKGHQPADGTLQTVRYTLYNQSISLSSNAGPGRALAQEVYRAQRDMLAMFEADFDFLSAVALGDEPVPDLREPLGGAKWEAIRRLSDERFDSLGNRDVLLEVLRRSPEGGFVKHVIAELDERRRYSSD